ncbi:MAG: hypothetical protein WBD41_27950 [Rhodococcus sp. (in: high G+C Gram-positive bacteria)]
MLQPSPQRRSLLVDCELVALNTARPAAALLRSAPVAYFVFDVLGVDGESVRKLPYLKRRRILDDLALADGVRVQVPPNMPGVDGETLMAIAAEHGIEGIVAKRADSIYRPGVRSKSWLKTPIRMSRDAVICGWVPTGGRAGGPLAALLLGAYGEGGDLVYIGSVGTGFTDRVRRDLERDRSSGQPVSRAASARRHGRRNVGRSGVGGDSGVSRTIGVGACAAFVVHRHQSRYGHYAGSDMSRCTRCALLLVTL